MEENTRTNARHLNNAAMAMVSILADEGKIPNDLSDIAEQFINLETKGVNFVNIRVEKDSMGYYSDQFASFIGRMENYGEATRINPITLYAEGKSRCVSMIKNACETDKTRIKAIASALNFDLTTICP